MAKLVFVSKQSNLLFSGKAIRVNQCPGVFAGDGKGVTAGGNKQVITT